MQTSGTRVLLIYGGGAHRSTMHIIYAGARRLDISLAGVQFKEMPLEGIGIEAELEDIGLGVV